MVFTLKRGMNVDELQGNPKKVTLLDAEGRFHLMSVSSSAGDSAESRPEASNITQLWEDPVNLTSRPGGPLTLLFQPTKATKSPCPKLLFIGRELSRVL